MTLLHVRGGWLYEHRPDLCPGGLLTALEVELWALFYADRREREGANNG